MATLTFSITNRGKTLGGAMKIHLVDVTASGNYTASGEAVTPANVGMSKIDYLLPKADAPFTLTWDRANSKIRVYESGTADASLDEFDAGALPATLTNTIQLLVLGR